MKNKSHTRFYNKVNQILEVPREVMEEVPKFTIISFDEMLIENGLDYLEYKSVVNLLHKYNYHFSQIE